MRFVKPLDEVLLHNIFKKYKAIVTIEDGCLQGGFGSAILEFAAKNSYHHPIKTLGIPDTFIEHGTIEELHSTIGIDQKSIKTYICKLLETM